MGMQNYPDCDWCGECEWCLGLIANPSPVSGNRLRVTRLDAKGEPIEGSTVEVGPTLAVGEPGEWFIPDDLYDNEAVWPEQGWMAPSTFTMDVQFAEPDPDLLALLTGRFTEGMDLPPAVFGLEVFGRTPVRRRAWWVVWEWLTRKPRQYTQHHTLFPSVMLESDHGNKNDYTFKVSGNPPDTQSTRE